MSICYQNHMIKKLPPTAFYVPNFISEAEEAQIVKNVYSVPKPKWTCLSNRRLQDYGGVPHKNGMLAEKIPDWLEKYIDKIKGIFPEDKTPNHVLINEYLPGQGIMPHTDGPLFYPTITTINCSSYSVLELQKCQNEVLRIFLEPRSLLILKDELYTDFLHCIKEVKSDILDDTFVNLEQSSRCIGDVLNRETRLSVTIRNVPKVAKIKFW